METAEYDCDDELRRPIATNFPSVSAQTIPLRDNASGSVRSVHVIPSGDVIILFNRSAELLTAQYSFNVGDHATFRHPKFAAGIRGVHVVHPIELVKRSCSPRLGRTR